MSEITEFSAADFFEGLFLRAHQNCVLVLNATGIVIQVNTAFLNCFSYKEEAITGKHFSILFTPEDRAKNLPDTELRNVLAKGFASDNNYMINGDGTQTWVSGESVRIENKNGAYCVLKVIQNIQRQKSAETEINRLNDLNEDILRTIDDVVILINSELQVIKTNNAFQQLFSQQPLREGNWYLKELTKAYSIDARLVDMVEQTLVHGDEMPGNEIEISTDSRERKIFDVKCLPVTEGDGRHVLLVLHDVTVYRELERERESMIAIVAHELRNPLTSVIAYTDLLTIAVKDNADPTLLGLLHRSKHNAERMNAMIAELYDTTKIHSGQLTLEKSHFHMGSIAKDAIESVQLLHPDFNIQLVENANATVFADRHRLTQVLINYLLNCVKYADIQSTVVVSLSFVESDVTVSVKDEGAGIAPEHLPYLFDRFYRVDKTRHSDGIGMGLYLCKKIIQAHHGRVWALSEPGKGSTFFFSIPAGAKE